MTTSVLSSTLQLETVNQSRRFRCVLCGENLRPRISGLFDTRFGIAGTYQVDICASCGLEQLVPRPEPPELKRLYEEYYNFGGQTDSRYAKFREWFFSSILYRLWVWMDGDISFHAMRGHGRLLDVGCNEGRGLQIYQRNGFEVKGLELNERAARAARQKGFCVYTESLEEFRPQQPYDIVVLSNVLEHSLDPQAMLKNAARILGPGGKIWISCPNAKSWLRSAFGKYWINWHVPFHISFFSRNCLSGLLNKTGFDNIVINQITPALWVSSSLIARASVVEGQATTLLRSVRLVPTLVFLIRVLFFPILSIGNLLGRGDCLVVTAIRSCD
jgi:2-polyprenyl-3-methyl-5-hydroxy-6-metoxy-1,4-benzoquinol methylase